jgi:hypothetical protein
LLDPDSEPEDLFPPKIVLSLVFRSDPGPIFSELPDPDLVLNEAVPQPWF